MILINDIDKWYYVNPKFPENPLSPIFDDSAYALQWRGRVGQENFGDIDLLQQELEELNSGSRIVLPKNKEHAEAMLRVAMYYLNNNNDNNKNNN